MLTERAVCTFDTCGRRSLTLASCLEDVIGRGGTNYPTQAARVKRAAEVREIKAFLTRWSAWGRDKGAGITLSKVKGAAVFIMHRKGEPTPADGWPMLVMPWKGSFDRAFEQLGVVPRFAGPKPASPAVPGRRRGHPVQAAQGTYFLP